MAALLAPALEFAGKGAAMKLGGDALNSIGGMLGFGGGEQQGSPDQVPEQTDPTQFEGRVKMREDDSLYFDIRQAADSSGVDDMIDKLRSQVTAALQAWANSPDFQQADDREKAMWWGASALAASTKSLGDLQTALQMVPAEYHSAVLAVPPDPDGASDTPPPAAPPGGHPGPGMPMAPPAGAGPGMIPSGPMMPPPGMGPGGPRPAPRPRAPGGAPMGFSHVRQAAEGWGEDTDYQHHETDKLYNPVEPDADEVPKRYATPEQMMTDLLQRGVPVERAQVLVRQAFAKIAAPYNPENITDEQLAGLIDVLKRNLENPASPEGYNTRLLTLAHYIMQQEQRAQAGQGRLAVTTPPITTPPPADQAGKANWITQRTMTLQGTGMDAAAAANQAAMEANAQTPGTGYDQQGGQQTVNQNPQGTANSPMMAQQPSGYQQPGRVTSISKWADVEGNPLEQGKLYQMNSPEYSVPDYVQVLDTSPEALVVNVLQDDGTPVEFEIDPEEAMESQYTFEPMGDHVDESLQPIGQEPIMPQGSRDPGPTWERTARSHMSLSEQQEFVDEPGVARNMDKLNLDGTHYPALKSRRRPADYSDADLADLFSRLDPSADGDYVPGNEDDYFLGI